MLVKCSLCRKRYERAGAYKTHLRSTHANLDILLASTIRNPPADVLTDPATKLSDANEHIEHSDSDYESDPAGDTHQQRNLFHRMYRTRVQTKPVRSLPPVLPDLLSPLCLSSLASGAPGRPTFPPKRQKPALRPHPLPAPSCCIRPLIFSSTGLLPTLTNCAHPAARPDPLSPLAT